MAKDPLDDKAQEFRDVVRARLAERPQGGRAAALAAPAGQPAAIDRQAIERALAEALKERLGPEIRAAVGPAVTAALAEHGTTVGGTVDPGAVSETVEAAVANVIESQGDILVHLRNVLPGQVAQELQQHQRHHDARLAELEDAIRRVEAAGSGGRALRRGLLTVLAVALVMVAITIFDRQIRTWGRQTIYPMLGLTVSAVQPTVPTATPTEPRRTTAR